MIKRQGQTSATQFFRSALVLVCFLGLISVHQFYYRFVLYRLLFDLFIFIYILPYNLSYYHTHYHHTQRYHYHQSPIASEARRRYWPPDKYSPQVERWHLAEPLKEGIFFF